MPPRLQGRVAVVSGSGQNIGRAIALELASQGAKVVTNSRSPNNPDGTAEDTAKAIAAAGGTAVPVFADVSTMNGAQSLIEACLKAYGTVDILVNNAGRGSVEAMPGVSEAAWDEMINVNLKSPFACIKAALPDMIANKNGRIINVGSRASLNGTAGMIGYASAKAGVIGMTGVLAREVEQHGITVNCIMPAAFTPRVEANARLRVEQAGHVYSPSNRTAEHIAPLVAYLATDEAAKINGQLFWVSGGEIIHFRLAEPGTVLYKDGKWSVEELTKAVPTHFGADLRPGHNFVLRP